MDDHKVEKIKKAIRENFDASADSYEQFEQRFGFFTDLTGRLVTFMGLAPSAQILDVGCGTGASSIKILESVPGSTIWGLDNSSTMLDSARSRAYDPDRLKFVEGDATKLKEYFDTQFEAIIYSASIFLIPDYRTSLLQARDLLTTRGSVGLTFMDGLYSEDGNNVLEVAEREANEGMSRKRPVSIEQFQRFFSETFVMNTMKDENFFLDETMLRAFFSVPAMSAGLFPAYAYRERVRKIGRLFDCLPKSNMMFRWILMVGRTEQ